MELVTEAFGYVELFSWWWLLVPVGLGVLLMAAGAIMREGSVAGVGLAVALLGGAVLFVFNVTGGSVYNQSLLTSDVAEQLKIQEVLRDGDWYTGKGSDGEFVKFALVKKDNTENTYSVLMEK